MRKAIKITGIALGITVVLFIGIILFIGLPVFDFTQNTFTDQDYRHIMAQNITDNPRVVDIAMLGAHDAFSNEIGKTSLVDPQEEEGSILRNSAAKTIAGGMFVRLAKAQKSDAYTLATHGVRYFDVRITRQGNTWYTTHGLLSTPLEGYVMDVLRFLEETQGEIIIFDMQHIWVGDVSMEQLFADLSNIRHNGKNLFDYVYYDPANLPLGKLCYKDVTAQGSGIVMLAKTAQYNGGFHYEYENSIRSNWHNQNNEKLMLEGIRNEAEMLKQDLILDRNKLRVNQAQMTGKYSPADLINTIFGWSLLDMGESFNAALIEQPDFENWFETLPILMTDYSDSMAGGFNNKVVEAINTFNRTLE